MEPVALNLSSRSHNGCAAPGRRGRPPKLARRDPPAADASSPEAPAAPQLVQVVESYFDLEGRPIKRKSLGAARVERSYDARGNQVEEAYFNTDGAPTRRKGLGAASIRWRYDSDGKRVEAALFGPDGDLLSRRDEIVMEKA
ncbi:MAG TPA: hypothetical protein VK446_04830 [Methylocystis sp.]|nr:hypothetical protein [Methylocystis sp.]